jgi:hypothetical protein
MAEFGSYAASAPATYSGSTITPAIIQTLSNYLSGWFGAVVGANSPAIEDMNALCYLFAYQLTYLMQVGVAEWDSGTTYFKGDIVNSGGVLYVSITDNNLNNAVTVAANWQAQENNIQSINPGSTPTVTLTAPGANLPGSSGSTYLVNSANGACTFNAPAPTKGLYFTIKDSGGLAGTNNITLHRNAAESIEGLAADYIMQANWGEWIFSSDGTNWFLVGR